MKRQSIWGCTLLVLSLALGVVHAEPPSPGQAALAAAAREGKYLFLLFYKQDDAATQAAQRTLTDALAARAQQARWLSVQVTNPAEKALVDHFSLSRSPMPLVVAVAPNGAITGGFALKLTAQDVASAFVSPGMAQCLKATQARKLVLVCVQPGDGGDLPAGVREFKADSQYGPATEVVLLRSADPAEAGFLKELQINTQANQPVTAFLCPPGNLLGTFPGAVTKQQLIDKLAIAKNSCCPGGKCGPGGCCTPQPKK